LKKTIILFLALGYFYSCSERNDSNSDSTVIDAFAKIDKKEEGFFTKEDRRKNYKNSLVNNLDKKESLEKNISYNGYGSSKKQKEKNKLTSLKLKSKNKKTNYSYQTNSAPQTYSTYSTN
tara:strand:- start:1436 stop:1795 length:360 start_codon:yes stop_codon:yes gene_type:complete